MSISKVEAIDVAKQAARILNDEMAIRIIGNSDGFSDFKKRNPFLRGVNIVEDFVIQTIWYALLGNHIAYSIKYNEDMSFNNLRDLYTKTIDNALNGTGRGYIGVIGRRLINDLDTLENNQTTFIGRSQMNHLRSLIVSLKRAIR